jgi:hypothetical protein
MNARYTTYPRWVIGSKNWLKSSNILFALVLSDFSFFLRRFSSRSFWIGMLIMAKRIGRACDQVKSLSKSVSPIIPFLWELGVLRELITWANLIGKKQKSGSKRQFWNCNCQQSFVLV